MQAETVHLFPERIPVPCYVLDPDNAAAPPRRFIGAALGWTLGHVLVSARSDGTGPVLAFPDRWGFVPVDSMLVAIPDAVWRPLTALVAVCALAEARRQVAHMLRALVAQSPAFVPSYVLALTLADTIPPPPPSAD